MSINDDIAFMSGILRDLYSSWPDPYGPPASQLGQFGVPLDMQASEPDKRGWVKWKLIPSTLTLSEICKLEARFGHKFPQLFRAYLMAYFHLFDYLIDGFAIARMPSSNPLRFLTVCFHNPALARRLEQGYIPFGEHNHCGVVAFDTSHSMDGDDYPVVMFTEKHHRIDGKLKVSNDLVFVCESFRDFVSRYFKVV